MTVVVARVGRYFPSVRFEFAAGHMSEKPRRSSALPQRITSLTIWVLTKARLGMNWRGTCHRRENGELFIRQLLPSVREKKEFLRMSLMKLPGRASDSLSETRRTS